MASKFGLACVGALIVFFTSPADAQTVAYSGKLQIGFGDQSNTVASLERANNAVPICAGHPPSNPASVHPAGTTLGTLIVNGRANQAGSGPGAALTFSAVTGTTGGAQQFDFEACQLAEIGFANPRVRSRTQAGAAHWPGRKGDYTFNIDSQPVPTLPTATYRISAGGGNSFSGAALSTTVPFFGSGNDLQRIVKGPANYGGGLPYSGGGRLQTGFNLTTKTQLGETLIPGDYGQVQYLNGFWSSSPLLIGTDAKGNDVGHFGFGSASARSRRGSPGIDTVTPILFPNGLMIRRTFTLAARTPGETTQLQQGAIRTLGGGNTVTPAPSPGPPLISPVFVSGAFFEWTTGTVTHTNMFGEFTTIRTAMGSDRATSTPGGATRRLQLVTPWAAAVQTVGQFGFGPAFPKRGYGGIAKLDIKIIPVPEPRVPLMLSLGALSLAWRRAREQRTR